MAEKQPPGHTSDDDQITWADDNLCGPERQDDPVRKQPQRGGVDHNILRADQYRSRRGNYIKRAQKNVSTDGHRATVKAHNQQVEAYSDRNYRRAENIAVVDTPDTDHRDGHEEHAWNSDTDEIAHLRHYCDRQQRPEAWHLRPAPKRQRPAQQCAKDGKRQHRHGATN